MTWSPDKWGEAFAPLVGGVMRDILACSSPQEREREFWERAFLAEKGGGEMVLAAALHAGASITRESGADAETASAEQAAHFADVAADEWRKRWGPEGSRR